MCGKTCHVTNGSYLLRIYLYLGLTETLCFFIPLSSSSSNIATFSRLVIDHFEKGRVTIMEVQAIANKVTLQKEVQNTSGSMQKIKTPSCYLTFDIHGLQVFLKL